MHSKMVKTIITNCKNDYQQEGFLIYKYKPWLLFQSICMVIDRLFLKWLLSIAYFSFMLKENKCTIVKSFND